MSESWHPTDQCPGLGCDKSHRRPPTFGPDRMQEKAVKIIAERLYVEMYDEDERKAGVFGGERMDMCEETAGELIEELARNGLVLVGFGEQAEQYLEHP
jgi:hypothetical protein